MAARDSREEDVEEVKIEMREEDRIFCIPENMYKKLDEEMRCGICLNVYKDPIELPCYHVFCLECLRKQSTIQKTLETFPRCAECNRDFNMRTLIANKQCQSTNVKINKLLEVYHSIRYLNDICSQEAPVFEVLAAKNQERIEAFRKRAQSIISSQEAMQSLLD